MALLANHVFFAILAFMSDPLSVYPAIIIGICLLTRKIGYGLRFGLFFGGFLSLLILGLSIGGVLSDLFEGAFHFNRSFYSKYTWTNPIRIKEFLLQIVTLLDLFQQKWFNLNPLRSFPLDITKIDEWAFTGLFYRLSIYFYATILFIQKKWLTAVSVFVFAAAILAMKTTGFYAQVFNLFALYCFVSFVSNLFKKEEKKPLKKIMIIGGVILTLAFLWLFTRVVWTNYVKPEKDYKAIWVKISAEVDIINKTSCGLVDVKLAAYPGKTSYYWFTDLEPVEGYLFMWPWVADYALDEVVEALSNPELKAIVISPNKGQVWGLDVADSLRKLHDFVTENYIPYNESIFLSPALWLACPENQSQ